MGLRRVLRHGSIKSTALHMMNRSPARNNPPYGAA